MDNDLFTSDREENPQGLPPAADPDRRHDKIILSLCLIVLALLIARNLLDTPRVPLKKAGTASVESTVRNQQKTQRRFKIESLPTPERAAEMTNNSGVQKQTLPDIAPGHTTENQLPPEQDAQLARMDSDGTRPAAPDRGASEPLSKNTPVPDAEQPPAAVQETLPTSEATDITTEKTGIELSPEPAVAPAVEKRAPLSNEPAAVPKSADRDRPEAQAAAPESIGDFRTEIKAPMVYSVQVGSFRTKAQADRHEKDLQRKGFDTDVMRLKDSRDKTWYVVQMGDFETRKAAEQAAGRFASASGVTPLIKSIPAALAAQRKIQNTAPDEAPVAGTDTPPRRTPSVPDLTMLVRQGAYGDAADTYGKHMRGYTDHYTIKLEVDCSAASVREAFEQGGFNSDMFLLPIQLDGKSCFLVMWGLYPSLRSATTAVASLPPFFRPQNNHPQPVRIGEYVLPD